MQLKKFFWKKSQRAEVCRYCGNSHPQGNCPQHVRSGRRTRRDVVFVPFGY